MFNKYAVQAFLVFLLFLIFPGGAASYESELEMFFSEEAMVETVSRHPKPLVKIAENITIVTASQIELMNAHTLYEVLNRVPGLFVTFNGADFGSDASLSIHGASGEDLHRVLVLLDGLRLNSSSNGIAALNGIPVAIIDRLEIIKGPASSTWGSSIGGVVNIITKKPRLGVRGSRARVSASYGEGASRDLRGEFESAGDQAGYYLYLGNQSSDGLWSNRYFDNSQAYTKVLFKPSANTQVGLTAGYFTPEGKGVEAPASDMKVSYDNMNGIGSVNLDFTLSEQTSLHFGAGVLKNDYKQYIDVLGTGVLGIPGESIYRQHWREKSFSLNSRLVTTLGNHSLVFGAEANLDQLDYRLTYGTAGVRLFGAGADYESDTAHEEKIGVFLHDTITTFGRLVVIPGLRYDYSSVTGSFFSPSCGITYPLSDNTRLRATTSRGFNAPYLGILKDSSPAFLPNPNLEPEKVWSIQAGLETKAIPFLLLKTTLFYHDIEDIWIFDMAAMMRKNGGNSKRSGLELELETVPWYHMTLATALTYTMDDPEGGDFDEFYKITVKPRYSNSDICDLELFGTYIHWLKGTTVMGEGNSFVWDLNLSKKIGVSDGASITFFMTIHNLTNEKQYWNSLYQNPERWVEAGLRASF